MVKVVINKSYGGFNVSKDVYDHLGMVWDGYGCEFEHKRTDPKLVACVELLGEKADGKYSRLTIVEIPDDVDWHIEEYDGKEWIAENHRTWD